MRRVAIVATLAVVVGVAVAPAAAQPRELVTSAAERLARASASAEDGDWKEVERLAGPVAGSSAAGDRAEAHRLLGLAAYHDRRLEDAEAHFLAYLQLDLDGRLDPSLYPPELVSFFEHVRSTHSAELRTLRPRPRRSMLLNLIPPAGQFQNKHPVKGWVLGGVGLTLLATNLTTYAMLSRWCNEGDRTCEPDGESRAGTARTLADLNYWSGVLVIGAYAYGVIDGFRNYRRNPRVMLAPIQFSDGSGVAVFGRF